MTADAAGADPGALPDVAAVVIGRNEGTRLRRCLVSLLGQVRCVVYVDSGSTDGSVAMADGLGAHVITLDDGQPFTAARARNVGFRYLLSSERDLARLLASILRRIRKRQRCSDDVVNAFRSGPSTTAYAT